MHLPVWRIVFEGCVVVSNVIYARADLRLLRLFSATSLWDQLRNQNAGRPLFFSPFSSQLIAANRNAKCRPGRMKSADFSQPGRTAWGGSGRRSRCGIFRALATKSTSRMNISSSGYHFLCSFFPISLKCSLCWCVVAKVTGGRKRVRIGALMFDCFSGLRAPHRPLDVPYYL